MKNRYKSVAVFSAWFLSVTFVSTGIMTGIDPAMVGVRHLAVGIRQETAIMDQDSQATMTTANEVYYNNRVTLTTFNEIKPDTVATLTTDQVILATTNSTVLTANEGYHDSVATVTTFNNIIIDTHATVTTENVIYTQAVTTNNAVTAASVDAVSTLTNTNSLYQDSLALVVTLTTLNSIKAEMQAILALSSLIDARLLEIQPIATDLRPEIVTTESIVNSVYPDVNATYTASLAIYAAVLPVVAPISAIYPEAHATLTTLNAIKAETDDVGSLGVGATVLEATAQSIKNDTSVTVSRNTNAISSSATTLTYDTAIQNQTKILAIPSSGGSINTSGIYRLTGNILDGQVVINASNVTLMLNGYTITNNFGDGIVLSSGVENVYIAGGAIRGSSSTSGSACIFVNDYCKNILIEHLSCGVNGLGIHGGFAIGNLEIRDCSFSNCKIAISLDGDAFMPRVRRSVFLLDGANKQPDSLGIYIHGTGLVGEGASITDCTVRGYTTSIMLAADQGATIDHCDMGLVFFDNPPYDVSERGIYLWDCDEAVVSNCLIKHLYAFANSSGMQSNAYGILCQACQHVSIDSCRIEALSVTGGPSTAFAYGIRADYDFVNVSNCVFDYIWGETSYAVSLAVGYISDCIAQNMQSITGGGATFSFDSVASNRAIRNISVGPAPATPFVNIANVTVGYAGSNILNNFTV